jgi:hypothetical protein
MSGFGHLDFNDDDDKIGAKLMRRWGWGLWAEQEDWSEGMEKCKGNIIQEMPLNLLKRYESQE